MSNLLSRVFAADVADPWVRHPDWLTMPTVNSGDQKIVGLMAVYDVENNYRALVATAAYTVDWGDGSAPENFATGVQATHNYDYEDVDLEGTDVGVSEAVACTFQDTGDTVTLNAHGWTAGKRVMFSEINTTTGISINKRYFLVNPTANTFQLADTWGGSAKALTTNGDGLVFVPQYRQAVVVITPQAGNNLTSIGFNSRHPSQAVRYEAGWLDRIICGSFLTSITLYTNTLWYANSERVRIIDHADTTIGAINQMHTGARVLEIEGSTASNTSLSNFASTAVSLDRAPMMDLSAVTTMASMFATCVALTEVPLYDTSNVQTMTSVFQACRSLQEVPFFDTSNATTMGAMFRECSSLRRVPLLNTALVTDMNNMFLSDISLIEVPDFDCSSLTLSNSMFSGCAALRRAPRLDLSGVTNASAMYSACNSLVDVPDFDLPIATNTSSMFTGCGNLKTLRVKAPASTNISSMFNACQSLQWLDTDLSAATTTTTAFNGCNSLARISGPLPAVSFSVASCSLGPEALNEIYTNLPTVVGQTITVTGNYGVSGDDPTIATAKGWTVTS